MVRGKVLIVEDERLLRWSLVQELSREGYRISEADSGERALEVFADEGADVVLLDIRLPGKDGIEVLRSLREVDANTVVIMMTAHGGVGSAVAAMKLGAFEYVEKPFDMEALKVVVEKAMETFALRREVHHLREGRDRSYGFDQIIGVSQGIRDVVALVQKVAQSDAATVLISGESGTGKDLVARVIHHQSPRGEKPLMEINCTAIPEHLIESELFGHERGAFTGAKGLKKGLFELADGGSVFLDEIGDMAPGTQAKLLKVIEDRRFKRIGSAKDIVVDVRILAATNKDLAKSVQEGTFREDLFYRINVIPIRIPPLRERPEDIPLMAEHFIRYYNREFKRRVQRLSDDALKALSSYPWPGNVRELRNIVERAVILEDREILLPEHLHLDGAARTPNSFQIDLPGEGVSLESVEKELIAKALEKVGGNQVRAAHLLGVSRDVLRYRMKKYQIAGSKDG